MEVGEQLIKKGAGKDDASPLQDLLARCRITPPALSLLSLSDYNL